LDMTSLANHRVLGDERTKEKAEAFAENIRQNNSPKPKPKLFRDT
jgi:hypothetical protein